MHIDLEDHKAANRWDPDTGVEEIYRFVGPSDNKVFVVTYRPVGTPTAALVVCPSLHAEMMANYRREVFLARSAAAQGIAVARFHYLGTGHSDGDTERLTVGSMRKDAQRVVEIMATEAPAAPIVVLGTRVGGLIAAGVADEQGLPAALWEPCSSGADFIRDALRARQIRRANLGLTDPLPPPESELSLGRIDVLGYPIHADLYGSLQESRLPTSFKRRTVLIAQISSSGKVATRFSKLAEGWIREGCDVSVTNVVDDESWWFPKMPHQAGETEGPVQELVQKTVSWIQTLAEGPVT